MPEVDTHAIIKIKTTIAWRDHNLLVDVLSQKHFLFDLKILAKFYRQRLVLSVIYPLELESSTVLLNMRKMANLSHMLIS